MIFEYNRNHLKKQNTDSDNVTLASSPSVGLLVSFVLILYQNKPALTESCWSDLIKMSFTPTLIISQNEFLLSQRSLLLGELIAFERAMNLYFIATAC